MILRDSTQIVNGNNKISHTQVKYNRSVWQEVSSVIHWKSTIVLNSTIHQQITKIKINFLSHWCYACKEQHISEYTSKVTSGDKNKKTAC